MRIVLDLPHDLTPELLAQLHALQTLATQHTLLLAVCLTISAGTPDAAEAGRIEAVRHAVATLPLQVHVYELPAHAGQHTWLAHACAPIRENFMAGLQADLVHVLTTDSDALAAIQTRLAAAQAASAAAAINSGSGEAATAGAASTFVAPLSTAAAPGVATPDVATPAITPARPRLAYISPLPPEKSGIADYSAELIPHLARHYEIEVVLDQERLDAPWIAGHIPLRSTAWFRKHAHEFQRVLYHFGNSPMHKHMFELFEQHPGVIVLHDFYLGNILDYLHHTRYLPGAFQRALYESHGWQALFDQQQIGARATVWKYPCNKTLLDNADGVIVHAQFPRTLAKQWYGGNQGNDWRTLPLLRGLPEGMPTREQARAQLGIKPGDFLVCSFGMLGQTKLNDRLLDAWQAGALAQDPRCVLVFVGENDPGEFGEALAQRLQFNRSIRITGFVSSADYRAWLQAADGAVQLRTQSRGETSAAVLDCLLHGIPTIVNAHGASAELPRDVALTLDNDCAATDLSAALEQLQRDAALRARLCERARAWMQAEHAPEPVAQQYYLAIEHFAAHGRNQPYRRLLQNLDQLSTFASPQEDDLLACAAAIAQNQPPRAARQCLIDISAMVQTDLRTGIQRVVRSILWALIQNPPEGYRIEPVFTRGGGAPYHYARQYMAKQLGLEHYGEERFILDDTPVELREGDLFLGLDLFMDGTFHNRERLQAMRDHGVQVVFIVYDILPLLRPDVFPAEAEPAFRKWLDTISNVSDGLLCISQAVARETLAWLQAHEQACQRQRPLSIGWFHLGADIDASAPSSGMPDNAAHILDNLRARPSLLTVGTVEPRKGHAQALAAFDILWQQGVDANLVVVGKHGWMVDALAKRLRTHPENGKRLFWLAGISDEMLLAVYQASVALLAPSEGEGFGLPLIEAAQHELPIIARALPVFKEIAGEHAYYFDGLKAQDLAQALAAWLKLHQAGQAPHSRDMPWLNWQQSAEQLKDVIWGKQWPLQFPATLEPEAVAANPAAQAGKQDAPPAVLLDKAAAACAAGHTDHTPNE